MNPSIVALAIVGAASPLSVHVNALRLPEVLVSWEASEPQPSVGQSLKRIATVDDEALNFSSSELRAEYAFHRPAVIPSVFFAIRANASDQEWETGIRISLPIYGAAKK